MSMPHPDPRQRELLAEALQLSRYLVHAGAQEKPSRVQQRQARLLEIRETLKGFAHRIESDRAVAEIPLAVRRAFVQATVLMTRYRQVGGSSWQGSLASPTLSHYHPDPLPTPWFAVAEPTAAAAVMITQLCQTFQLPTDTPLALADTLAAIDQQIIQQQQIMAAVWAEAGGTAGTGENRRALFQVLFGPVPLPVAAIDVVYTDMQLFFCVDYQDDKLTDPSLWRSLDGQEQQQIATFLQGLKQFSFAQFQRFPVFGPCTAATLDYDWCDRVAQRVGVTVMAVIQALTRSVGILPTPQAEAFLIHDIWGHHWQLMLTQFRSDYGILTYCDQPLRAAETAYTPHGPLTCRELFARSGTQVTVNVKLAQLFFQGEVQQRLGLLFTHLIGEMIADVAEFKFVWENPQSAAQLPSSSLFKAEPTKLDLSLADVDFLFLRVLQPLLELRLSLLEDTPLETDLLSEWADPQGMPCLELRTSLKGAIAHLYQVFMAAYNRTYLPTMTGDAGLFTEIVGNLLHLQNVVNSLYVDRAGEQNPQLPFQDLLIIFIGCYCSSDSYSEFWTIDDVLAAHFLPCWHLLCQSQT